MARVVVAAVCVAWCAHGLVSPGPSVSRRVAVARSSSSAAVERREGALGRFAGSVMGKVFKPAAANPSGVLDQFDKLKRESRSVRQTAYDEPQSARLAYLRGAASSLKVGLVRGLAFDVGVVVAVAVAIAGLDFSGFFKLRLSPLPLALTAPVIALLIAFRTNAAFARWSEARSLWGGLVARVRDLTRQGTSLPSWEKGRYRFSALAVAFAYALKAHLAEIAVGRDESEKERGELRADLGALLGRLEADEIMRAAHKPHAVTKIMTRVLGEANLEPGLQARVDEGISDLLDYVGLSERIVKTPIPLLYTRLAARALCGWLFFLPPVLLGLGLAFSQVVAATALAATLLLAADEVGVRIEEPFSVLPLAAICDGLRAEYDTLIQAQMYGGAQPTDASYV